MYLVKRYQKTGNGFKERLIIKSFQTLEERTRFMSGPNNDFNKWAETDGIVFGQKEPVTKSGTYAYAGGKWHNVKTLDASVLAHI